MIAPLQTDSTSSITHSNTVSPWTATKVELPAANDGYSVSVLRTRIKELEDLVESQRMTIVMLQKAKDDLEIESTTRISELTTERSRLLSNLRTSSKSRSPMPASRSDSSSLRSLSSPARPPTPPRKATPTPPSNPPPAIPIELLAIEHPLKNNSTSSFTSISDRDIDSPLFSKMNGSKTIVVPPPLPVRNIGKSSQSGTGIYTSVLAPPSPVRQSSIPSSPNTMAFDESLTPHPTSETSSSQATESTNRGSAEFEPKEFIKKLSATWDSNGLDNSDFDLNNPSCPSTVDDSFSTATEEFYKSSPLRGSDPISEAEDIPSSLPPSRRIQYPGLHSRKSTSSYEYFDDEDDDEATKPILHSEQLSVTDDEGIEASSTIRLVGEQQSKTPITDSFMESLSTKNLPEFPRRVESYMPSTQSAQAVASSVNSETHQERKKLEISILSESKSNALKPEDSPVYFPPASASSNHDARASMIPAAAVTQPKTPATFYDNVQILEPASDLLITPENLPTIAIKVISTRMRNIKSKSKADDPIAILSIRDRSTDKEWWKATKTLTNLTDLDTGLRAELAEFSLPRLPDRVYFTSLAPAKVDARKRMIESYFSAITSIPSLNESVAVLLCGFLSSDIIDPMAIADTGVRKEGYLTKRGKNFGGWKARFFVLDGGDLEYFDAPGGNHLGTIKLENAEIYRQEPATEGSSDGSENPADRLYRHALQISERKRNDSNVYTRHVLCAENDQDRDEWVEALKELVTRSTGSVLLAPLDNSDAQSIRSVVSISPAANESNGLSVNSNSGLPLLSPKKKLLNIPAPITRKLRLMNGSSTRVDSTTPTSSGFASLEYTSGNESATSVNTTTDRSSPSSSTASSQPVGSVKSSANALQVEDASDKDLRKQKKRSIFSLRKDGKDSSPEPVVLPGSTNASMKSLSDQLRMQQQHQQDTKKFLQLDKDSLQNNPMYEYRASVSRSTEEALPSPDMRPDYDDDDKFKGEISKGGIKTLNGTIAAPIFGVALSQAIEISYIQKGEVKVPSIVYRCFEYLDHKRAAKEEGIFRLSGSSIVIRALKDRFNHDGDVDLVNDGANYDVHAVASLLKLYFRELPVNVLTTELQSEFIQAMDMENRQLRTDMLYVLLRQLPRENFSVLKALSRYLIKIVENYEQNKMTLRNVGIVFAPTLNISNLLVTLFIVDYAQLFIDKT
ncbi:uncharacterized protein V1516DRAFT_686052 [Lipomyces oligophaga]|uniref:uncharacterized protein n=1 Tax=Lipomyces oligophaga TaxID=45792 RepID=UPI0034CE59C6